eukprot:Tbor_TRINITY_DN5214_c4_g1::TRINITY_DN5214_c4_g1_i1::g.16075::m.16075
MRPSKNLVKRKCPLASSLPSEVATSSSFELCDGIRLAASRAQMPVSSAPITSGLLIYGEDGQEENGGYIGFGASGNAMGKGNSNSRSNSNSSDDDEDRRNGTKMAPAHHFDVVVKKKKRFVKDDGSNSDCDNLLPSSIQSPSYFSSSDDEEDCNTSVSTTAGNEEHTQDNTPHLINSTASTAPKGSKSHRESFAGAVFVERNPNQCGVSRTPQAHLTLLALHSSITLQGPCYVYGMGGETSLSGYFIGSGGMYLPSASHRVCVIPMGKRGKKKKKSNKGPLEPGAISSQYHQTQRGSGQRSDGEQNDDDMYGPVDETNKESLPNKKTGAASSTAVSEDAANAASFGEVDWGWVTEQLEAWNLRFGRSAASISILLVLTHSTAPRLQWFEQKDSTNADEGSPRDLPGFISRAALPRMEPAIMDVIQRIVFSPLRRATPSLHSMPRVMVVGDANIGKTTLAMTLANGFISHYGVCYWLDLDLGQPLQYLGKNYVSGQTRAAINTRDENINHKGSSLVAGPLPSCMTLLRIQKPITAVVGGLHSAKPPPLEPREEVVTVVHQIYLGTTSTTCPFTTAAAVKAITEVALAHSTGLDRGSSPSRSFRTGGPLVVNTHGWVKSTGRRVTIEAFQRLKPTHVLHLCHMKEDAAGGGSGKDNKADRSSTKAEKGGCDIDVWTTEEILCKPANGFNTHTISDGRSGGFRRHFGFNSSLPLPSGTFDDATRQPQTEKSHDSNGCNRRGRNKKISTEIADPVTPSFKVFEVDIITKPAAQLNREAARMKLQQPREGLMQMKRRKKEEMESQEYDACEDKDSAPVGEVTGPSIESADCVVYRFHLTRGKKAFVTPKAGQLSSNGKAGHVSNSVIRRNMWFQHFFPCFSANRERNNTNDRSSGNDDDDEDVGNGSLPHKRAGFGCGRMGSSKIDQGPRDGYCVIQLGLSSFLGDLSPQCAPKDIGLMINRIILAGVDETCAALYNKEALGAILRHSNVAIAVVTMTPTSQQTPHIKSKPKQQQYKSHHKNGALGGMPGVSLLSNISYPVRGGVSVAQPGHLFSMGFPRVIAFACVLDVFEDIRVERGGGDSVVPPSPVDNGDMYDPCIQRRESMMTVELLLPLPARYNNNNDASDSSSSQLIVDYILRQQQELKQEGHDNEICLVVGLGDTKDTTDVMGRCCDVFH